MVLLNLWSLGHFVQWFAVGRRLFTNWYLFITLSVGWELIWLVLPYEFAKKPGTIKYQHNRQLSGILFWYDVREK